MTEQQKQGQTNAITQQGNREFKGKGVEGKKETGRTSIITIRNGKPTRVFFEHGKEVAAREIKS